MELLTNDLKEKFKDYPIYSQDGKGKEAIVLAKFFNPYGLGAWYVLEAEPIEDGADYRLFGYVESNITPDFNEYAYFMLSELEELRISIDITDESDNTICIGHGRIERDILLDENTKLKDVIDNL